MTPKLAFVPNKASKNHALSLRGGDDSRLMATGIAGLAGDVMTAAATASVGDCLAQFVEHKRKQKILREDGWPATQLGSAVEDMDFRRTGAYAVFNGVYSGGFQHFLFAGLNNQIADPVHRLILNQGLIIPLIYYPLLIWMVPKLRSRSKSERTKLRESVDVKKMIPKNWAFWVPLQFIQFNFIPAAYQVTYCAIVGFVWKFLLSILTAGSYQAAPAAQQDTAIPVSVNRVDVAEENFVGKAIRALLHNLPSRTRLAEATA